MPDLSGREAILAVHAKKVKTDASIALGKIALATAGLAGADLANSINEAALLAVKMKRQAVIQSDLLDAVELVVAGKEKKNRILTEKDKRLVAFHEVGHALAAALQKNAQPVQKITIVPRTTGSLGHIMQMPEEERFIMTKDEMSDQITVMLAGRAAERLIFDMETTGASNDIDRATKDARKMVTQYGMTERFGMMGLESVESKYLDGRGVPTCSEQTGAAVDEEIMRILKNCYEKAYGLLEGHRNSLETIAEELIAKETITGEEFMDILKGSRM
jgi:cell division protease FtsH